MLRAHFRRINPFLPTYARIKFFNVLIFPYFDRLFERTAQMIFDLPIQTLTATLLAKLKWMSLMDRV